MDKKRDDSGRSYTLSYPRVVRLVRAAIAALLAIAALVEWVLAWLSFARPLLEGGRLADQPLRPLLAANAGLLITVWSVALIFALLPDLALSEQGLAVRTLFGWRTVPWGLVSEVRTVPFTQPGRRLVLVQGVWRWSGLWSPLVSMCLGAGQARGVMFSSAIRDFEPLVDRLRQAVAEANPNVLFDDEFFSLPARLVFEPRSTLSGLTKQARENGWPLAISAQAMAAVTVGLLLIQLLVLAFWGGAWWQPLVIVAAGAAEWGAGALYLYALGGLFPGDVEMRKAVLLYPIAQVPRALLALPMFALVAAGLPSVAAAVGAVGIVWAVWLTALVVQYVYRLPAILPALFGASIQALFQLMLLALIIH